MNLDSNNFEILLPSHLTSEDKGRLATALAQFKNENSTNINYDNFYHDTPPNYLLQGDLVHSVKIVDWDENEEDYYSGYSPVMVLSNTCDMSSENLRGVNQKQSLVAPIIKIQEYIEVLRAQRYNESQLTTFLIDLKKQVFSNLLYLPAFKSTGEGYIVFLDKMTWHPTTSLLKTTNDLETERFLSLSNFGFYMLALKLSYHLFRLPEEKVR